MQIWTILFHGIQPEILASKVHLHTLWATEQTYRLWKPIWSWISAMLTFRSISFPSILICFEVITWCSSSNCAKIMLFLIENCTFVWKRIKGIRALLPLVFIYFGNYSYMYLLVRISHLAKNAPGMFMLWDLSSTTTSVQHPLGW